MGAERLLRQARVTEEQPFAVVQDTGKTQVISSLAGMTNGAYQQIPWAMYPDLMDVTRAQSGAAIEGAFRPIFSLGSGRDSKCSGD